MAIKQKKPLTHWKLRAFADRTGNLNLILTYPKLTKHSNIKGLPLYSSHLNRSKLTKIGGSSHTFCYIVVKLSKNIFLPFLNYILGKHCIYFEYLLMWYFLKKISITMIRGSINQYKLNAFERVSLIFRKLNLFSVFKI